MGTRLSAAIFSPRRGFAGFTLVELVVVIAITGIIAASVAVFILRPIQGFDAQARRAELIEAAENALRRMQRDIRRALPNSVRIRDSGGNLDDASCTGGGVCAIEVLNTIDGGRYRADPPGGPNARMQFGALETDFDVIGTLQSFAAVDTANHWLVINNQATTGTQYNAYFGDNRAGLDTGTTATHINLDGHTFASTLESPRQRFYIVDTPISYLCDTGTRTLNRYQGYAITANHAAVSTDAGLMGAGAARGRAADLVAACRFAYQPGTGTRAGLVTLEFTLRDPDTSEQVRLLHQVHVYNAP